MTNLDDIIYVENQKMDKKILLLASEPIYPSREQILEQRLEMCGCTTPQDVAGHEWSGSNFQEIGQADAQAQMQKGKVQWLSGLA